MELVQPSPEKKKVAVCPHCHEDLETFASSILSFGSVQVMQIWCSQCRTLLMLQPVGVQSPRIIH